MTLEVWQHIRQEVKELAECEPMLASFFYHRICSADCTLFCSQLW